MIRKSQAWATADVDFLYTITWETEEEQRKATEELIFIIRRIHWQRCCHRASYVCANLMKEVETSKDEMKAASGKSN